LLPEINHSFYNHDGLDQLAIGALSSYDTAPSPVAIVAKRVEWAFGKWYSRKPLLQSGDINYETWFQTTTRG
jgi:hypothetical protein